MNKKLARVSGLAAICSLAAHLVYGCSDDDAVRPSSDAGGGSDTGATLVDSGGPHEDAAPTDAGAKTVSIKFKAKVGTQDFKCGTTYANQGSTMDTVEPRDLRFFVQDVKLVTADGKETPVTLAARPPWQTPDVALLDFEDGTGRCANGNAELNGEVIGTVPSGSYTGVVFSNGVPAALNHSDPATATAPLSAGGMTWSWLSGRLFIKAEMASTSADGGVGLLHLGSTGCTNALDDGGTSDSTKPPSMACSRSNRNLVKLSGFDPEVNVVVFDVAALFANSDLTAASLCHSSGPACPPMFTAVGVDIDGGAPLSTVPVFRVE